MGDAGRGGGCAVMPVDLLAVLAVVVILGALVELGERMR